MTRKNLLSSIIALFAITLMMVATGTSNASSSLAAQPCCHYSVTIKDIPDACFFTPLKLYTRWDCSGVPASLTTFYGSNGSYVHPLQPCPCKLIGASLDGITYIDVSQSHKYIIGNCCYELTMISSASGCISFQINPC